MEIEHRDLHRIVSTAIIYKDGPLRQGSSEASRYLLVHRGLDRKVYPGKWTVPGGGLEVDDYINTPKTTKDLWYGAIEKSLRREVKEECNLEVGKVKYLLDIVFIRPDGVPAIILSFYCPYKSGEVKLDSENTEYTWATYEECKKYDLIDGILEEIEMVDKILKGEDENNVEYKR